MPTTRRSKLRHIAQVTNNIAFNIKLAIGGSANLTELCRVLNRNTKNFFEENARPSDADLHGEWTVSPADTERRFSILIFTGVGEYLREEKDWDDMLDLVERMLEEIILPQKVDFSHQQILMQYGPRHYSFFRAPELVRA